MGCLGVSFPSRETVFSAGFYVGLLEADNGTHICVAGD